MNYQKYLELTPLQTMFNVFVLLLVEFFFFVKCQVCTIFFQTNVIGGDVFNSLEDLILDPRYVCERGQELRCYGEVFGDPDCECGMYLTIKAADG